MTRIAQLVGLLAIVHLQLGCDSSASVGGRRTTAASGAASSSSSSGAGSGNGSGTGSGSGTGTGTNAATSATGSGASSGSGGSSGSVDPDAGCGLRTCQSAGAQCGPIGDGCGATIYCGDCPAGQFCGGTPSTCLPLPCTLRSCSDVPGACGVLSDGCGGTITCLANCPAGQFCGGGGPNQCGTGAYADGGSSTCTARTCQTAGATCGPVADGCGGLTPDCGSCTGQDICGGGGIPNVCGANRPDAGSNCTNLCLQQQQCSSGTTSISGKVYAPNGQDPLYGALVYVPNGTVDAFAQGLTCLTCEAQISGSPLVSTNTNPDGTFTLNNMPVGSNIPLVIQLGRWRRQVTIPNVAACTDNPLPSSLTRLPKNQSEGDIPRTAMVTGSVDALECVLRKIGLDDSEFTNPGGSGRIQLYSAAGSGGGATIDGNTPDSTALIDDANALAGFDMVLFACEGYQNDKSTTELGNILDYANHGGRVFATHFSYTWLYSPTTWQGAANWDVNADQGSSDTGHLDTGFPKGQAFSQWLDTVGASTSPGSAQISINQWRWDVDSVIAPAQQWIYLNQSGQNPVQHMTFNTPFGANAAQQCGRVLFSDFHVTDATTDPSVTFPSECSSGGLTAQEHVLEFMLFDLASCITPDNGPPPTCTPIDCATAGATCGPIGDGCGGTKDCGTCPTGQTCGGGGVASQCGTPTCTPLDCAQQGLGCGPAGDGCGGTIDCGGCSGNEICGGGGTSSQCGHPPCTPTTCSEQGAQCGAISDGCGSTLDCGACTGGQICGLGGANICGGFR